MRRLLSSRGRHHFVRAVVLKTQLLTLRKALHSHKQRYPHVVQTSRRCDESFCETEGDRIGSSAHTDWGFITLVDQGDDPAGERGGLEAWIAEADASTPRGGYWKPIPPLDGARVVNCGDWVSLFSRGRIQSPLHRVVNGTKERTSLVFFAYPSFDAALPSLSAAEIDAAAGVEAGGASGTGRSAATRLASLSLLADQSQDMAKSKVKSNASVCAEAAEPFGTYISRKWAEVARST